MLSFVFKDHHFKWARLQCKKPWWRSWECLHFHQSTSHMDKHRRSSNSMSFLPDFVLEETSALTLSKEYGLLTSLTEAHWGLWSLFTVITDFCWCQCSLSEQLPSFLSIRLSLIQPGQPAEVCFAPHCRCFKCQQFQGWLWICNETCLTSGSSCERRQSCSWFLHCTGQWHLVGFSSCRWTGSPQWTGIPCSIESWGLWTFCQL